jgi:hypothetical protein
MEEEIIKAHARKRSVLGRRLCPNGDIEYFDPFPSSNLGASVLATLLNAHGVTCPHGGKWRDTVEGGWGLTLCDCGREHWFKAPGWIEYEGGRLN